MLGRADRDAATRAPVSSLRNAPRTHVNHGAVCGGNPEFLRLRRLVVRHRVGHALATVVVMATITQCGGRGAAWGARRGWRVGATTGATPGAGGAALAARVAPRGLVLHLVEQLKLGDQTA